MGRARAPTTSGGCQLSAVPRHTFLRSSTHARSTRGRHPHEPVGPEDGLRHHANGVTIQVQGHRRSAVQRPKIGEMGWWW